MSAYYTRRGISALLLVNGASVVADRFANLPAETEADFAVSELERIDDSGWLTTVVHPSRATAHGARFRRP
ncbi:MAG: hypothetical protein OZ922_01525 [Myxococcales bacterium]|nr:hypothetical protein [Myxococcales bacterium]